MEIYVGLYDVPIQPRIHLTCKIIHNTPNVICMGTDGLTDSHIFTPDSGISSHSFGRSYCWITSSGRTTNWYLRVDTYEFACNQLIIRIRSYDLVSPRGIIKITNNMPPWIVPLFFRYWTAWARLRHFAAMSSQSFAKRVRWLVGRLVLALTSFLLYISQSMKK